MSDAKQCPHCKTWALKDAGCSYIFACGLDEKNTFQKDTGCGKSWCWTCGKNTVDNIITNKRDKSVQTQKTPMTPRAAL